MTGKYWTEDEIVYLEYCYYDPEEFSIDDIAEHLGRTKTAVHNKAYELRRDNKNFGSVRKRYSEKEIKKMISSDHLMTRKELAEVVGRGVPATGQKLRELGVKKNKSMADYDSEIRRLASEGKYQAEICRILGIKDNSLHYHITKHGIKCEKAPKEVSQAYWRKLEQASLDEFRSRKK